jgi:hypothetical protein
MRDLFPERIPIVKKAPRKRGLSDPQAHLLSGHWRRS